MKHLWVSEIAVSVVVCVCVRSSGCSLPAVWLVWGMWVEKLIVHSGCCVSGPLSRSHKPPPLIGSSSWNTAEGTGWLGMNGVIVWMEITSDISQVQQCQQHSSLDWCLHSVVLKDKGLMIFGMADALAWLILYFHAVNAEAYTYCAGPDYSSSHWIFK